MREDLDVAVVGGGLIGLSIAWRLGQRGLKVKVFERGEAGRGTSWHAAGMLAPSAEIGFEELDLYRLGRESLRRWSGFARELHRDTGLAVGYNDTGTLVVAVRRDDVQALRRLYRFQQDQAAPVSWITGSEALDLEPLLSPRLPAAIYAPEDHQVDHRAVLRALIQAVRGRASLVEGVAVRSIEPDVDRPRMILDDGQVITARRIVVAAGAWARELGGIKPQPPVRPVKGQALSVASNADFAMTHTIRGPDAYLVPKADGRIVMGATSEEVGFDQRVTAGGLYRILEGAVDVVPGIEELEIVETWAGLRPASRDHAPLLGQAAPGVVFALGHYRHGVLLTPITADEIAADIAVSLQNGDETSPWLAPFSPYRFSDT